MTDSKQGVLPDELTRMFKPALKLAIVFFLSFAPPGIVYFLLETRTGLENYGPVLDAVWFATILIIFLGWIYKSSR